MQTGNETQKKVQNDNDDTKTWFQKASEVKTVEDIVPLMANPLDAETTTTALKNGFWMCGYEKHIGELWIQFYGKHYHMTPQMIQKNAMKSFIGAICIEKTVFVFSFFLINTKVHPSWQRRLC